MEVTGRYFRDQNFTTILCNGVVYTIARNSGQVGEIEIGEHDFYGHIFTEKDYAELLRQADKCGTFDIDIESKKGEQK